MWIVYEYAPQDLGRTLRDPTVVRSHAHIKAWAKMLLEGRCLMVVVVVVVVIRKSRAQRCVVVANMLLMIVRRRVAVVAMPRHVFACRPRGSPRELFHTPRY
jgi:hypothetical protein